MLTCQKSRFEPLGFFVWGYLDSKLTEKKQAAIEDAKIIVEEEVPNVTSETLRRVGLNFGKRTRKSFQKKKEICSKQSR